MASMLQNIASGGISYMYQGPWANKAVAAVAQQQGSLSLADLASYRPTIAGGISTTYDSPTYGTVDMYATGLWYGGVDMIEAANLIELAIADGYISQPYDLNATSLFWMIFITRWGDFMSGFYLTEAQRVNIYFPYLEIFYVFLTLSNPISLHSCSPALIYHSRTGSPSRVLHRSGI